MLSTRQATNQHLGGTLCFLSLILMSWLHALAMCHVPTILLHQLARPEAKIVCSRKKYQLDQSKAICVMMMTSISRQDVGGGLVIGPSREMLFALDNVGAEGVPLRYPSS